MERMDGERERHALKFDVSARHLSCLRVVRDTEKNTSSTSAPSAIVMEYAIVSTCKL
jgi:hypothetical protein